MVNATIKYLGRYRSLCKSNMVVHYFPQWLSCERVRRKLHYALDIVCVAVAHTGILESVPFLAARVAEYTRQQTRQQAGRALPKIAVLGHDLSQCAWDSPLVNCMMSMIAWKMDVEYP